MVDLHWISKSFSYHIIFAKIENTLKSVNYFSKVENNDGF